MKKISEYPNNSVVSAAELLELNKPDLGVKNVKEFSGYSFWQYTSVESIGKILGGNCFWLNSISEMNDKHEAELHADMQKDIFVQSFCNSDNEKIPLWYLYGGIAGKGASIGFTPRVMLDYINSIKYARELIKDKDGNYVEGDKLFIGKQLELQVGWVFYVNYELPVQPWTKSSNTVWVNFFSKFWNVKDAEHFFANNYFIKDYPWEYEKEFRLVFINKTGRKIDKIKIESPEILRNNDKKIVKVKLAPEISNSVAKESDGDEFKNCSDRLDKIAKKNRYQLNVSKSELKINMNLLERSKDYINDYILSHPEFIPEETAKKVEEHYQSVRDAKKNT